MRAWRKQLLPASFRGVPFYVKSVDTEEGRRSVLHEYPLRDDPFVEDLGRKAGEFGLEAIVVGDDYFKARDALRAALKAPGPGELVHPTLGRLQVSLVATYRLAESLTDEGGMARFSLRFTESQAPQQPTATVNTPAVVDKKADAAMGQCTADFARDFSVDGLPEFGVADATKLMKDAVKDIKALRSGLTPDLSVVGEFVGEAVALGGAVASLITLPATLATRVFGLVAGLRGAIQRPWDAVLAMARLFGYEAKASAVPTTTPSRRAQAGNRTAIERLVSRAALIEAARATARIDFASPAASPVGRVSHAQAATLRESIADALETEAAASRVEVFEVLMDLRAAVVRDITARGADLPRLAAVTLPATLPALVVAYRALGDATRDAEIVARNPAVRHPGFVPGGVSLEVLA